MDEFPTDDDFDLMHADELEVLKELEGGPHEDDIPYSAVRPSTKRSLDFSSPLQKSQTQNNNVITDLSQLSSTNPSKKRSFSQFEDFDDDLIDDFSLSLDSQTVVENCRKKPRLPNVGVLNKPVVNIDEQKKNEEIINKIILERSKFSENEYLEQEIDTDNIFNKKPSQKRLQKKTLLHKRIPEGAFQSVTTSDGSRYYLNVFEEDSQELNGNINLQSNNKLLAVPFNVLRNKAEKELERLNTKKSITVVPQAQHVDDSEDSGVEEDAGDELWVQLYKPKLYLDLLSDEATNRLVLQWVKLWDKVVFGKQPKVKQDDKSKKNNFKDKNGVMKFKFGPELNEELDEHGRPAQKVVLLCGPPGLGKTTLAHIIAKHAGYNIVEMNASDDRSVEAFKTTLENATSMKSVLGKDHKPNCLIIDEIDGAPAATINFLVNFLNGKDTNKGKKKKDAGPKLLQRPVICICNDLYTAALRPLRQMALVIHFPPTLATKLATRLFYICKRQNMRADFTVLMALCDKTENDIRSCLAVLQFLRSTRNEIRFDDINTASVGMKDYQRSLFSVWNDMFTIPRPKRRRRLNPHELQTNDQGLLLPMPDLEDGDDNDIASISGRFYKILKTTQSCGEYDKLVLGWFENYLNIKFKHKHLEPVVNGLDWTTFNDIVTKEINHGQNWILMGYLPYACVSYHLLFAGIRQPSKLQFPTRYSEHLNKLTKSNNLISTLIGEMTSSTRVYASKMPLIYDLLPFLLHIIQPSLRPVNTHLYSSREKEELYNLVNTMIGYNLTYTQEKLPDGQYLFNLDPNMEEVVRYSLINPPRQLSYTARQLVAREIELEKMRRSEVNINNKKAATTNSSAENPTSTAPSVPNHLQKLQPKLPTSPAANKISSNAGGIKVNLPKDFFGRVIEKQENSEKNPIVNDIVKSDIWFKFKEGYSNAVRRTIKIIDLTK